MICDFCSAPDPTWCFPTISFPVLEIGAASEGDWAACDICAALIGKDDRAALARRSAETFSAKYEIPIEVSVFADLHQAFFENRCGAAKSLRAGA